MYVFDQAECIVTVFMIANRRENGTEMVMPANPPVTLQGHSMNNIELRSLCPELT